MDTPEQAAYRERDAWGDGKPAKTLAAAITHVRMAAGDALRMRPQGGQYPPGPRNAEALALFRRYLHAAAAFGKARSAPQEKGGAMRNFQPAQVKTALSSKAVSDSARHWASEMAKVRVNESKLKRLCASFAAARDDYQALAVLARFYSLSGLHPKMINAFVTFLGQHPLEQVQALMLQALLFWRARGTQEG